MAKKKAPPPAPPQIEEHDLGGGRDEYYDTTTWKGVKTVFRCCKCGAFRDTRDEMIEHILFHYPLSEQERVLNQLVKEK